MNGNLKCALITGASKGIGLALAHELARRGHHLALVSLPNENLLETAAELSRQYGVETRCLEVNLAKEGGPEEVWNWAQRENLVVSILVNNAGFGQVGRFWEYDAEFFDRMLRVNLATSVYLSRKFLESMMKLPEAYILNLGSIASFLPIPHKIIYSGTKGFMYFFSRGLQHELRHTNVHVCVLCPNAVLTNDTMRARVAQMGRKGRWTAKQPEEVAQLAVDSMFRKKKVVIPGWLNRVTVRVIKWSPLFFAMRFMEKNFERNPDPEAKGDDFGVEKPLERISS